MRSSKFGRKPSTTALSLSETLKKSEIGSCSMHLFFPETVCTKLFINYRLRTLGDSDKKFFSERIDVIRI